MAEVSVDVVEPNVADDGEVGSVVNVRKGFRVSSCLGFQGEGVVASDRFHVRLHQGVYRRNWDQDQGRGRG